MGNNSFLTMPTTVPDHLIESGIAPANAEAIEQNKDSSNGRKRTSHSPYPSSKRKK